MVWICLRGAAHHHCRVRQISSQLLPPLGCLTGIYAMQVSSTGKVPRVIPGHNRRSPLGVPIQSSIVGSEQPGEGFL